MAVCSKCNRAVHDEHVNKAGRCVLCADGRSVVESEVDPNEPHAPAVVATPEVAPLVEPKDEKR